MRLLNTINRNVSTSEAGPGLLRLVGGHWEGVAGENPPATVLRRPAPDHPGVRLPVFEESGHSPFYEEPERFGRELAAFAAAAIKP